MSKVQSYKGKIQ